jgi:3',5'-cyclic AMP phosphodiesterase CpdA
MTSTIRHSFLVISDIHCPADGLLLGSVDPIANLRMAFSIVGDSGFCPQALVFSGDIAHGGETGAYRRVKPVVADAAQQWRSQVLYLPGNHDHHADVFRAELLDADATSADQVLWLGDLRLIGLDSSVPGQEYGRLTDDQLSWTSAQLATPAPEGTIVILHHQPIRTPEPIVDALSLQNSAEFAAAMAGSDVRMVISGHSHHASGGSLDGRPVWLAPSLSFTTDVLASSSHRYLAGGAFTRVDVFDDSVVATAVPLLRMAVLVDIPFDEVYIMLGMSGSGAPEPVRF